MGTTFTTSVECFTNALGTDEAPDAYSMPTLLAIDGYRTIVFNLIKKHSGITSVSEDVDGICKGIELELVSAKIQSVVNNTSFFLIMPQEYINLLQSTFTTNLPMLVFVPNENG